VAAETENLGGGLCLVEPGPRLAQPDWAMRCDHVLAFDDFIGANGVEYNSASTLYEKLGQFDQIALFCALSSVPAATGTSTAQVLVYLEHSGDGENFIAKNSTGAPPTQPEIDITWTARPSAIIYGWGSDPTLAVNPPTPFQRFVRIGIYMTNSGGPVRARVYATLRDQSPSASRIVRPSSV
jgi:hypothetical protein